MHLTRRLLLKAASAAVASGLILPASLDAEALAEAPRKWWFLDRRMNQQALQLKIVRGEAGVAMAIWDQSVPMQVNPLTNPATLYALGGAPSGIIVSHHGGPTAVPGLGARIAGETLVSGVRYYGRDMEDLVAAAVKDARKDSGRARVLVAINGGIDREYPLD